MATVNKNFRIKNGLVIEGTSATVNGNNILSENASDSYIINLIGGTATNANTPSTVVKRDASGNFAAGTITADLIGDVTGTVSSLSNHNTDDLTEGTNQYFTNQRALDATSAAYDTAGTAQSIVNALGTDDIEEGLTNQYFTNSRARGAISSGTGISYDNATGVVSVDNTIATEGYVDTAVNNLIGGAPGLLDTLNEIAAAINDDANYFTTVTTAINTKQDALTAGTNIDITSNTISVTGLDTDDVAEGTNLYFTDSRARTAVDGTSRSFTDLAINSVSKEIAATTGNIVNAAQTAAYAWPKADYRSAKLMVKVKNGAHTEISEILVTLDTSDNVSITEYGMSSTSGTALGTITADVSGSDVRILVTPANNNSEVMVAGTLVI